MFEPGRYPDKGWRVRVFIIASTAAVGLLRVALYFTTRTL